MPRLLYVEGSPRKERSVSTFAAKSFLEGYTAANPRDHVDHLDIWGWPLPELDQDGLDAKYAGIAGAQRTPPQAAAWAGFEKLARQFIDADKILISTPMWNFTIPYKLKQLVDAVSHKDLLFTFDERGLQGLLTKTKAFLIYSRGISYSAAEGTPPEIWDHQKSYMELWLKSVGVPDIGSMIIERTFYETDAQAIASKARALGGAF